MASAAASLPHRNGPPRSPAIPANAPSGTFLPGTKVQVGSQRVTIEKYLSSGGFAHVYVVRVPRENHKHELAVLKRVAVPDKEHLTSMRTEVETMKKLKGHRHVVSYMDSHASQLKGGGYEVFLLMEYCAGGGLIDFMNTRLQHRLTEPEILKIFGDVAEGVACMHYLKPPLLHRDLKVENVLISKSSTSDTPIYKLCDFGSAAPPRPAAKTADEGRLIEEDVQKHTTMQYRSPEMIDVWRKQPIDEKADIWALGVFLYKLCYYTTPFEDVGQMAILNASYKYPSYPSFSDRLKKFIGSMLTEDPRQRPNIYQVIKEVCVMQGTEIPIKDIYAQRTQSEARRNESLPSPESPMAIGLQKEAPKVQVQSIPDIAPMRRGRPTAPSQQAPVAKPSPSPSKGDPFAALDSKNYDVRAGAVDELSKRFPSLDEFSIVHEKGGAFALPQQPKEADLNVRVTNALADEVFNQTKSPPLATKAAAAEVPKSRTTSAQVPQPAKTSPIKPSDSVKTKVREIPQQSPLVHQPNPIKPSNSGVAYKSTGTGASPPTSASASKNKLPEISSRPIWKVPSHNRASSQPRASEDAEAAARTLSPSLPPSQRPALLDIHRSKSQTATLTAASAKSQSTTSSRPSLEGHRPNQMDLGEQPLARTKSAGNPRQREKESQRPSSVYVSSNLDYLRDQETTRKARGSIDARRHSRQASMDRERDVSGEETNIEDDMEYLRSNEEEERKLHHRALHGHSFGSGSGSGQHKKRGSLQSLAGRFGDAFKRFEGQRGSSGSDERGSANAEHNVPAEMGRAYDEEGEPRLFSSSPSKQPQLPEDVDIDSDDIDETEDLPPDVRRELERRRLSQEEKRVEAAAAEYRARVAAEGTGGAAPQSRASTIQKRVKSLLDEAGQESPQPQQRIAEGYGRFTDSSETSTEAPAKAAPPPLARKPIAPGVDAAARVIPYPKTRQQQTVPGPPVPANMPIQPASAPPTQTTVSAQQRVVSRPSVPPKSQALRTGGGMSNKSQWPPTSAVQSIDPTPPPNLSNAPKGGLAALLAKDLEGVPDYPPAGSSGNVDASPQIPTKSASISAPGAALDVPVAEEDLERDFSKRYPSLSGIEMVETEIEGGSRARTTMREV